MVQWSRLWSANSTESLMNTATLLSTKVTNRLRWMQLRVQSSFLGEHLRNDDMKQKL